MRATRLLFSVAVLGAGAAAAAACSIDIDGAGEVELLDASHPTDATMAIDSAPPPLDGDDDDDGAADASDAMPMIDAPSDHAAPDATPDSGDGGADADAADAPDAFDAETLRCDGGPCYALHFDGNDDVTLPINPATSDFTLEAFIKPTTITNSGQVDTGNLIFAGTTGTFMNSTVTGVVQDGQNDFWVDLYNSGTLSLAIGSSDSGGNNPFNHTDSTVSLGGATPPTLGNGWSHIAVTRQQTAAPFAVNLYINGQAVGSSTMNNNKALNNAVHLAVGPGFVGLIDDVRVWTNVRSASAILADVTTEPPTGNGLVVHWTFDEGTATTMAGATTADSSNSFNVGVLGSINNASYPTYVVADRP